MGLTKHPFHHPKLIPKEKTNPDDAAFALCKGGVVIGMKKEFVVEFWDLLMIIMCLYPQPTARTNVYGLEFTFTLMMATAMITICVVLAQTIFTAKIKIIISLTTFHSL